MTYNTALPIYHVAFDEIKQENFLNIYDLLKMVNNGTINKDTYVWKYDLPQWTKARNVPELKPLFVRPPDVPEEIQSCNELPD